MFDGSAFSKFVVLMGFDCLIAVRMCWFFARRSRHARLIINAQSILVALRLGTKCAISLVQGSSLGPRLPPPSCVGSREKQAKVRDYLDKSEIRPRKRWACGYLGPRSVTPHTQISGSPDGSGGPLAPPGGGSGGRSGRGVHGRRDGGRSDPRADVSPT